MLELIDILSLHAEKYPLMLCEDAVKLVYQNEFAGGHMIKDASSALAMLRREFAGVERRLSLPLYEPIGNGIVRVDLCAVDTARLPLEALNSIFVQTANSNRGDMASFKATLGVLSRAAAGGMFSFTSKELDAYLLGYAGLGYPAVSHSAKYRLAYRPAYRVVDERLLLKQLI